MLVDLVDERLIRLNIVADTWEDAIRKAARPLLDERKIEESYIDEIITSAKRNGPYFVLAKHVALPHARPEAGALENAIGIATLKKPIKFGSLENDPIIYLFCLSAKNSDDHVAALAELAGLLLDEEFFMVLDSATEPNDIIEYIKQRSDN